MAGLGAVNDGFGKRWPEVEAWLDRVLDQPAAMQTGWLRAHCADPDLREQVLSLLDADARHGARLEARATAAHDALAPDTPDLPQVPGYRVLRLVGEGGMASVFLAERVLGETVQRVAIKRLRLNVFDHDERRRFEHEHRILARLEHPHIARLIDADIAPDGVPWFAMEYVEGEPLLAWCDARRLDVDARLSLMQDVAAAIHYAHRHLVVHRDLKPSNILVNSDGMAKVLDFGIARLLEPDGEVGGTRTAQRRLTPGYAAPEQYDGRASTATDVFALGVILVELISGQRPAAAREAGSDPLRGLDVDDASAQARANTPHGLARMLSGDIGAIARKALRKDPALRYGSAEAFAEDLSAVREHRPVSARRGERRYRAACFIARHKASVSAGAVIAVALLAATAVSLSQAHKARENARQAQAVETFVEDMLAPLQQGVPQAQMPRLDTLLASGVARIDAKARKDPAVYTDLLLLFARTYENMGEFRTADALAERAYRHARTNLGPNDPRTIRALAIRGSVDHWLQRSQARSELTTAITQMQAAGIEGAPLANAMGSLGDVLLEGSQTAQAARLYAQAEQERVRAGLDTRDVAGMYARRASVEMDRGRVQSAMRLYAEAYRRTVATSGQDSVQSADYLGSVAAARAELGDWRGAARDYAAMRRIYDRSTRRNSDQRLNNLRIACQLWTALEGFVEARRDCDGAVGLAQSTVGTSGWLYAASRRDRIPLFVATGRLSEAAQEAAAVRRGLHAATDAPPMSELTLANQQIEWLRVRGDYTGLRHDQLAIAALFRADHNTWVARLVGWIALACDRSPSPDCPADLARRADALLAEPAARDHPERIEAQLAMARLSLAHGDAHDAGIRLDDVVRTASLPQVRLPATHRWLAESRMLRGDILAAQGDPPAARREWRAAEAVFSTRYPADHPFRRELAARLSASR
jgi:eukaryotic-like serine/threonine-protein kinase